MDRNMIEGMKKEHDKERRSSEMHIENLGRKLK